MTDTDPDKKPQHVSKGERLFDWITYGGMAGLGTFLITIPIAFHAKYGKYILQSNAQ